MQVEESLVAKIWVHYLFVWAEASEEVELDVSKQGYHEIIQIKQMIEILAQVTESHL